MYFGFGAGQVSAYGPGSGTFDNINITSGGTPPADPKITSITVSGTTATVVMTGTAGVDYYCAGSGDLTSWTTEVVPSDTGSPFQTDPGGDLTFTVDVSSFGPSYFLRVQDTDPAP